MSVDEWAGRAILRDAEGKAQPVGSGFAGTAEQRACSLPFLVQPRAAASASGRADAGGGVGREGCLHVTAKNRGVVRGVGWIAGGVLLAALVPTPFTRLARHLDGRSNCPGNARLFATNEWIGMEIDWFADGFLRGCAGF